MATYNAKTLTITNNGDNYIIDPLQGNDVAYRDITVNIDAEDWTLSNNVYSYVWTNSYLTQNSQVQVYFKANVRGGLTGDLRVQKTTGQITFSTGEEPTDDISLLVRIIDANTTGVFPINADMVETDAIVGETDVQGALEDLDERIRELSGGAGLEVSFSIPANGWSNSAPYEYTWRSSNLRAECTVEAEFYSGAENTDAIYFEYEKVDPETTGGNYGVKFTSPNKPASAVPVCVRINNAKAEAITSVNAAMVATDAISGAANVQEALSGLNNNIMNLPKIKTGRELLPSDGTKKVTFSTQFPSIPKVVASWSFGTESNVSGDIGALKLARISATGFTVSIGGDVPSSMVNKLYLDWIAIA